MLKFILMFIIFTTIAHTYAYSDAFIDVGYSNVDTPFGDNVDLIHAGIGGTMTYGDTIFMGLSGEYRALTRLIKFNKKIKLYRNQKEITLNPVIGFALGSYVLKISSQNLGYTLLKQEKDGVSARGSKPSGFDITILKRISDTWLFGSRYSSTTFRKVDIQSSEISQQTVNSATASFILAYGFK